MIIVNDIVQGSDEWLEAKLGKVSASRANLIVTTKGKQTTGESRKKYMYELAAERITGMRDVTFKSAAMEVGNEREEESRKLYEMMNDVEVEQVGLIYKDDTKEILCSPDGIVNRKYGLELKNVLAKTQVGRLIDNKLPTEYVIQIQFSLWVTGFDRWDFCSYSPSLKPLIIPVYRDNGLMLRIEEEVYLFNKELKDVVRKIA